MDSKNYKEGQSMQRPPLFEANCFIYWKNRFETFVKSKDIDLWHIIAHGNYIPMDDKNVVIPNDKLQESHKKMISKNDEAKMFLYNALPKKEYERIFMCDSAQDIWNSLIMTHQGNKQVKDNKINAVTTHSVVLETWVLKDQEHLHSRTPEWIRICLDRYMLHRQIQQRGAIRGYQFYVSMVQTVCNLLRIPSRRGFGIFYA